MSDGEMKIEKDCECDPFTCPYLVADKDRGGDPFAKPICKGEGCMAF